MPLELPLRSGCELPSSSPGTVEVLLRKAWVRMSQIECSGLLGAAAGAALTLATLWLGLITAAAATVILHA